jgi:hypothetical protein
MERVADEAIRALASDPAVYQRGRALVHVVRTESDGLSGWGLRRRADTPTIATLAAPVLRGRLAACASWLKLDKRSGGWVGSLPPQWCVDDLHARGAWPGIRVLAGMTESPMLRWDGSVLSTPGYDPATGLLFEPNAEFLPVPASHTIEDVRAACQELHEVVCDFPFATPSHRSAWLAGLLTPLARGAIDGPVPGFLFDANTRASGKTLLADVIGVILTGRMLSRMTMPTEEPELRKVLFALALEGEQLVLMDEARVLFGAALDAALTGTRIKDRILGESRRGEAPVSFTIYFAGNNVQVRGDTIRRILPVRLESVLEKPEERDDFKHPDLLPWVKRERPRLHRAALTILRAYCAAGRPNVGVKPWGSFDAWSDLVRSALIWAGEPDPCDSRAELTEADADLALLKQLMAGLLELGDEPRTVRDMLGRLESDNLAAPTLRGAFAELDGDKPSPRALGNKLRKFKGRVADGKRLECTPDRNSVGRWRVVGAGSAGSAGSIAKPYARETQEEKKRHR